MFLTHILFSFITFNIYNNLVFILLVDSQVLNYYLHWVLVHLKYTFTIKRGRSRLTRYAYPNIYKFNSCYIQFKDHFE